MIKTLFYKILYNPLYSCLIFLVKVMPFNDLGLAIIVLTIFVRFIIFPFSHKSTVTQRKIKEIEPDINKIKNKFKNDRQEQTRQIMNLYKIHGISPFSGFLLIFIQLPVFIALFLLFRSSTDLPAQVNTLFLGLVDITKSNYFISALAAISQFFQIKLAMPKTQTKRDGGDSFGGQLQKSMAIQMKYIMPVLIFFIAQRFSSGLALYWTTSNVFGILHEMVVAKKARRFQKNGPTNNDKDNNRGYLNKTDG